MNTAVSVETEFETEWQIDPIEEIRLRTWARINYAPQSERNDDLHPIILDEMIRKDREAY